VAPGEVMR